jgi:hypothetical protein
VITGPAQDGTAIEHALDVAAEQQNVTLDDSQRAGLVSVLEQLRGLDFGEYAHGYQVEQLTPNNVRVVVTGTN